MRRIFRKLGTNSVWSYYSLKGKKGKQAFADIPICSVVISKCTLFPVNIIDCRNICVKIILSMINATSLILKLTLIYFFFFTFKKPA